MSKLFFSQPMMNQSLEEFNKDTSCSARFARVLPAHSAHLAMWDWESSEEIQVQNRIADIIALVKTASAWVILCFLISLAAQTTHEKNWKG